MKFLSIKRTFAVLLVGMLSPVTVQAEEVLPYRMQGDIGMAVYQSNNLAKGDGNTQLVVPYAYFDYGPFFARFDTFGIKTIPVGYGYLEIVRRINLEGFRTDNAILRGLRERRNSHPMGIGTFQETPIGGFFLNAFHDTNRSGGQMYELIYASKFDMGNTVVYPMFGFEHFTSQYTQYFYGVSPAEAKRSVYPAYAPKANTTTMLGAVWDVPVAGQWHANIYMLRRWLGSAITQSPLVNTKLQDEAFFSISYRY